MVKNEKHLIIPKINYNKKSIGKIVEINKIDIIQKKKKENIELQNKLELNDIKKNHIKFLFELHFYFEKLNYKIKQSFKQNQDLYSGFIINK